MLVFYQICSNNFYSCHYFCIQLRCEATLLHIPVRNKDVSRAYIQGRAH